MDLNEDRPGSAFGWPDQLALAVVFLTRVPMRTRTVYPEGALARAAWGFPLIGGTVGVVGGFAMVVTLHLHLPTGAAALLGIGATILTTGGLHEDGLADMADGFGGGHSISQKLDIMKDSRIGAYGVLALIVALGLKITALVGIAASGGAFWALIAAHAMSRGILPGLMHLLPSARSTGLGATSGQPTAACAYAALCIGWLIAAVTLGIGRGSLGLLVALACAAGTGWLARRQIGGYTGDVLGAAQQIAETAILLAAASA